MMGSIEGTVGKLERYSLLGRDRCVGGIKLKKDGSCARAFVTTGQGKLRTISDWKGTSDRGKDEFVRSEGGEERFSSLGMLNRRKMGKRRHHGKRGSRPPER